MTNVTNATRVATPDTDELVAIDVLFDLMRSLGQYPSEDELTELAYRMLSLSKRERPC
jgi:hypothetical protein